MALHGMFVVWTIVCLLAVCSSQQAIQSSQCSYYGSGRTPEESYSLPNCTWYRERSCCRHTEVTSVFQGMMSLHGASQECHNHMNYLMCYFCSPEQGLWYKDGKLHVCGDFCSAVYKHCGDATYLGKAIGAQYSNGLEFCEAQLFKAVQEGGDKCFSYDSSLFGSSSSLTGKYVPLLTLIAICMKYWLLER